MNTRQFLVFLFVMQPISGIAQDSIWKDSNGNSIPDSNSQKSRDGFGGWLIITSDANWQEKWSTPVESTPNLTVTSRLAIGETVTTLIVFANPGVDESGGAHISCDIRVTRPDETVSADMKNVECFKGALSGNPMYVRLSAATIQFVGEPDDPLGEWVTEVTLTDEIREINLHLNSSVELVASEP